MVGDPPVGRSLRIGTVEVPEAVELAVAWSAEGDGWLTLTTDDDDVALCLTPNETRSCLRIGARQAGNWVNWGEVSAPSPDAGLDGPATVTVTLGPAVLAASVDGRPGLYVPRPASLRGALKLSFGGSLADPRFSDAPPAALAMAAAHLPSIADRGLGETFCPDLIYDVGMHVGQDTDFYLAKGFRVVAVEANPLLAAQGQARFAPAIHDGRLEIVNVGLAALRGTFSFFINPAQTEFSSFDREVASRGQPVTEITVGTLPIGDVLAAFGVPHYLKIDIEAYDGHVIRGLQGLSVLPRYLSIENGPVSLFDEIVELGYARFKLIEQSAIAGLAAPQPAREGRDISYRFPYGSSGPFGEETPGEWIAAPAMRDLLIAHHARREQGLVPATEWYDLHAAQA